MNRSAVSLLMVILSGCAAFDSPDLYNRHRLSDIAIPRDPAVAAEKFYFDASVTAEFPDTPAFEPTRLQWLDGWLQQREMCPGGREILARRSFKEHEDNPARRNLRYEVRCLAPPPEE